MKSAFGVEHTGISKRLGFDPKASKKDEAKHRVTQAGSGLAAGVGGFMGGREFSQWKSGTVTDRQPNGRLNFRSPSVGEAAKLTARSTKGRAGAALAAGGAAVSLASDAKAKKSGLIRQPGKGERVAFNRKIKPA